MDRTRLKEIRESIGFTQSEMGDLIGYSLRGYQDLEYGVVKFRSLHTAAYLGSLMSKYLETKDPKFLIEEIKDAIKQR